ncbi:MAG TPA: DUF1800 domain-containing protein, partial [Tepidisphaeraceae bacterium]|nr:DUF1800 domain-containing protein [Tepidisphaeraceae bacterium]
QQLHPESIADSATDKLLVPLDTLTADTPHLMSEYFGDIRRFIEMQQASGDPEDMKMRYVIDVKKSAGASPATTKPAQPSLQELSQRDALRCIGELQQAKLIRAVMSERQLNEVMVDFWTNHFNIDIRKGLCRPLKPSDDRDVIRPHVLGKFRDLLGASAHSPAMLHYLDNAENSVARQRSAIEMKIIDMYVQKRLGMAAKNVVSEKEGPNENYGREILELHTLGVDGGYTQKDVQEVARCFSGWGLSGQSGKFEFRPIRHDKGEKLVLGHVIPAGGGEKDGEMVLDLLAKHPSTARFVSRKLCQRFVSDDPPSELVDRAAKKFLDTDGDLRQVVESIVTSPEFFSTQAYRAKIKSPFEYAVSAVRATGGRVVEVPAPWTKAIGTIEGAATLGYGNDRLSAQKRKSLNWCVFEMGEPLFAFTAPTGYPEVSSKWVSPGALIDRLNFALALTEQNVTTVHFNPAALLAGTDTDQPDAVLGRLSDVLLHGQMTDSTRQTLVKKALPQEGAGATVDVSKLTALILGSPEFQRR